MKVLVVHDRDEVSTDLISVVERECPGTEPRLEKDVMGAVDALRSEFYDLLILDLTIPYEYGHSEPTIENAQRLLERMLQDPALHSPADILGITNDEAAIDLVKNSIGQLIMTSVQEDASGAWMEKVAEKVRYVRESRRAREVVMRRSYDVDLGIITALDKEAAPYRDLFALQETEYRDFYRFTFTDRSGFVRKGILLKSGRSGQAPAASDTQALISIFRPRLLVMTGFCGGRAGRVEPGDLVAFNTSYAWDYGKWVENETEGQPSQFEVRPTPQMVEEEGIDHVVRELIDRGYKAPPELAEKVREMSGGAIDGWKVRRAAAASGSAVVTSEEVVSRIKSIDENIYAVDMESYGFYLASRNTRMVRPDFLCMKAVADFCNGEKDSRLHDACCLISASFLKELVTNHYSFGHP